MLLIKHGMPLKDRLHEFISTVKPETILKWNRRMKKAKWTYDNTVKNPGRPGKGKETEEIIMKLAWRMAMDYVLFFIHLSRNKIIFCFSDGAGICKTNAETSQETKLYFVSLTVQAFVKQMLRPWN
jgi:hypothetical protein